MNSQPSTLNSQPSIHVHIERLVLDGLPLTNGQGRLVQAGVEAELARLLGADTGGMSPDLRTGGATPSVRAGDFPLRENSSPAQIARQIADTLVNTLKVPHSLPIGPANFSRSNNHQSKRENL